MRLLTVLVLVGCCVSLSRSRADEPAESLNQKIEVLELKLQLAEVQIEELQNECEALRKENASLRRETPPKVMADTDHFAAGSAWAGHIKGFGDGQKAAPWAISIAKRDGDKLEGVIAMEVRNEGKVEFGVVGQAPRSGNGLVVIESPLIGRARIFMRGTLRNGSVALTASGTNPLGKKFVGTATLFPKY